jgi:two-component system alkaline phosphatase synthesis response regulator PhoP
LRKKKKQYRDSECYGPGRTPIRASQKSTIRHLEKPSRERDVFRFDDVQVNFPRMHLCRKNTTIPLTPLECKLLRLFLNNPNRVIPLTELLAEGWDDSIRPSSHAASVHIYNLRQKLEHDPASPLHLRTVHGVGYKFVP